MPTVEAARRRPGRPRDEAIDAAILAAAIDEYIERGRSGASMESVAARAGVAKTTLYRRWSALDELVLDAMRSLRPPLVEPAEPLGPRARLSRQLQTMRELWVNPRFAAVMRRAMADGADHPELYREYRQRFVGPQLAAIDQTLRDAIDAGLIRADVDTGWVRQMLFAPVLAATLTHKSRVSAEQLEFTIDTVLAGLAP